MDNERLRSFVHGKLLELLKFADSICKKEGIKYSLLGGSMLGAVRHNGFIPWDDDVDIVMPRADFERFQSVAEKYLKDTPFVRCRNGRVDGIEYALPQECDGIKVSHLCLDVFILDNVPDDDSAYKKQVFGLKKLQGMMKKGKVDWKKYSFKGKILVLGTKLLGMFHSEKKLYEKYMKLAGKYNGCDTKRRFVSNDLYSLFDIAYDKELVDETIEHKFETESFPIFKHYDEILTLLYGDYMTPPPIEERVFLHTVENEE